MYIKFQYSTFRIALQTDQVKYRVEYNFDKLEIIKFNRHNNIFFFDKNEFWQKN